MKLKQKLKLASFLGLSLALGACNGGPNSQAPTGSNAGAESTASNPPLPPEHPPSSSILKDPRLIWNNSHEGAPLLGCGYIPTTPSFPESYWCFLNTNIIEETNITESGFYFQAKRSEDGYGFSFYIAAVHITRSQSLPQLIWDEQAVTHLTSPQAKGGLGLSNEEVTQGCGSGVVGLLYGQEADLGFEADVEKNETTPPDVTLAFENTPDGIAKLEAAYAPYKKWAESKVGSISGTFSPVLDLQLSDDQRQDYALIASTYLRKAEETSQTSADLRKGDDLSDLIVLVDKAPKLAPKLNGF